MNAESKRLFAYRNRENNWKKWGPYLSDRAWGTVREDYGKGGPWESFPFEEAHKRPFRWGEDGIGGICDRFQYICFAPAFWNHQDPLLKERLFGLSSPEGNHGEDVKEQYYYLDGTPSGSYLKMLYKYPQARFPYEKLREENKRRTVHDPEYELADTGIFNEGRYFDIYIEYAKADLEDILCRITIINRGPDEAPLSVVPTLWFRNIWKWGYKDGVKPRLYLEEGHVCLQHRDAGNYFFYLDSPDELLFCENDSDTTYTKDAFHQHLIQKDPHAVDPLKEGTKCAGLFTFTLEPNTSKQIYIRLSKEKQSHPFKESAHIFEKRMEETDQFYAEIQNKELSLELKAIQRQAFAGIIFSKQFYYLDQLQWENGDPKYPAIRDKKRNSRWENFTAFDIFAMPDKWEFPYFCAWDTAFHCIPMTLIDPDFAKRQLTLLTREWYMHPNGQLPAYEWNFSDVNPPVHAWALWRTYKIDAKKFGKPDREFLEGIYQKLLLNFTWWINRVDSEGNNIFQGGFLGMDNIGLFDQSQKLKLGYSIDQSDGTAWMSFFCIIMMKIALHLSLEEPVYQDGASKFFEHFLRISSAMNMPRKEHLSLWDEQDGFYYDLLHISEEKMIPLKVRSLVGLLPLLAVETFTEDQMKKIPVFKKRMDWLAKKRPHISCNLKSMYEVGDKGHLLISIVSKERLLRILKYLFDEREFLSPFGIRSLSKHYQDNPYTLHLDGEQHQIKYVPGEADNRIYGGNSNWRGPIWFPINYLLIEALQKYHYYYGDQFKVEFPTGSGVFMNLWDISKQLSERLISLFLPNESGRRPIFGDAGHDHLLFFEFFNPETGKGLGASHQTGWTALVAKLIQQSGEFISPL